MINNSGSGLPISAATLLQCEGKTTVEHAFLATATHVAKKY